MNIEDVIEINLVLVGIQLLASAEERARFRKVVGREVVERPAANIAIEIAPSGVSSSPPLPNERLLLNRDRIIVDVIPDRSTIARKYPNEDDIDRLVEVINHAIEQSDVGSQKLRAYGINLDAVYELPTEENASQFIAKRIFFPDLLQKTGSQLVGGSAKLHFLKDGQTWNVAIEPRFGKLEANKVFVSLNLHKEGTEMPSQSLIGASFREVWKQADSFMDSLNRSIQ